MSEPRVNKTEFIAMFAARPEISLKREDATTVVNAFLDTLSECLEKHGSVQFSGFGCFNVSKRKERKGKNLLTQEDITIQACNVVAFKSGKRLKGALNKG